MKTKWWIRFIVLLVVMTVSIMMIVPTALKLPKDSSFPFTSKINLGLDLQGGLYMILGIDFNKVYRDEVTNLLRNIQSYLKDDGLEVELGDLDLTEVSDPKRTLIVSDPSKMNAVRDKIKEIYPSGYYRLTGETDNSLQFALHHKQRQTIEEESVQKSIEVIRNRIDEFGVTEPEITSQGNDRIVVQLPGVKDIERAKDLIGKTAKLEFRMVNSEVSQGDIQSWLEKADKEGIKFEKGQKYSLYIEKLNQFLKDDVPKNHRLVFERTVNNLGEVTNMIPYIIESEGKLSGDDLQDALVQIDQEKQTPYVSLTFKAKGAEVFGQLTEANVGRLMAIVLDGNVYTAPRINERIGGGRAQITLGSGGNIQKQMKEASDIALILRAGALPVQLEFQEQRIVGPQLGEDSIVSARKAGLIGCIVVLVFILIYYKLSGAIAVVGLTLNIVFILAALISFEATLTLPGIAGIALTVGMAIDASIIIFERIREELRSGKSYYQSVENGFGSAFWTILDANITTALAGFCLLNFGTGPVRGFAVTLLIGIVATVYTSYFVGSLLFQLYMNKVEGKSLSI